MIINFKILNKVDGKVRNFNNQNILLKRRNFKNKLYYSGNGILQNVEKFTEIELSDIISFSVGYRHAVFLDSKFLINISFLFFF